MNSKWSDSLETPYLGQNRCFLSSVTLKFDGWPWKTIEHLFSATSSFVHHFITIGEFNLELHSGNAKFGWKSTIFFSCVTLIFHRWPWKTSHIKLCATFHHHIWTQTGVTVGNGLIGLWPLWPWPLTPDLDILHRHHVCHCNHPWR